MPKINLTEKTLKAIKSTDSLVYYWDESLPGFGLYVKGDVRTYVVKGRVNGRQVMHAMGKCKLFESVKKAREQAKAILGKMKQGINPKKEKEAAIRAAAAERKKGITLGQVFKEYLDDKTLKDSTRENYALNVNVYLSDWVDRPLRDIDYQDVKERHKFLSKKRKPSGSRKKKTLTNGPGVANGVMRTLRAVFNYAIEEYPEIITVNPVKRLKTWNALTPKTTRLTDTQIPAWYMAVLALDNSTYADALTLLLFTGLRSFTEAFSLKWEDVNMAERIMIFRDTKNHKDLELPMVDTIYEMLKRRRTLVENEFVFPASSKQSKTGHISDLRKALAIINEAATKKLREADPDAHPVNISPHSLRRTFITIGRRLKIHIYVIKALVNHSKKKGKSTDITEDYDEITIDDKLKALQMIEGEILRSVNGTNTADVIPITRSA